LYFLNPFTVVVKSLAMQKLTLCSIDGTVSADKYHQFFVLRNSTTRKYPIRSVSKLICSGLNNWFSYMWYFIKTFNIHILNSKIQVPLFWLHVSVLKYHLQAILNLKCLPTRIESKVNWFSSQQSRIFLLSPHSDQFWDPLILSSGYQGLFT
jgi:hypothetical protein